VRAPQITDTVVLKLILPASTQEWADELLSAYDCERVDETGALFVTCEVGGNCNAITSAAGFLRDVEEALSEGDIDPMEFTLVGVPRSDADHSASAA
jgi:hypothetical protein